MFLSVQFKAMMSSNIHITFQVDEKDPFDTTMVGPWMGQWELVNHNRHTTNFKSYDHTAPDDQDNRKNRHRRKRKSADNLA